MCLLCGEVHFLVSPMGNDLRVWKSNKTGEKKRKRMQKTEKGRKICDKKVLVFRLGFVGILLGPIMPDFVRQYKIHFLCAFLIVWHQLEAKCVWPKGQIRSFLMRFVGPDNTGIATVRPSIHLTDNNGLLKWWKLIMISVLYRKETTHTHTHTGTISSWYQQIKKLLIKKINWLIIL